MNWNDAIKIMNIPIIYHECNLNNCKLLPEGIVDLGKRWVKNPNSNLYLHGNTGSGKTHFSISLYRNMVEKGFGSIIIYIKSEDLDNELLNSILDGQEMTKLKKYSEIDLLFIDDLGVEKPTDRSERQYYSIIDKRTANNLPTVITSNVNRENLKFGDRTKSRLEYFYDVHFPDVDLRKKIKLPPI